MKFGFFDDGKKEYVITTPETPLPWINYLGSEAFFALLSNTAGGYCFYKDARLRRITRYRYNNSPTDMEGFRVYIRDGSEVWNPGWMPVRTKLDRYECRHGLGYTAIEGAKNGITARQTFLVPKGGDCLLMQLHLENVSAAPKEIDVFSYLEFCLWDAMDDASNFQRNYSCGEVEVEANAIYHKTEYRERRDHYAVYWASEDFDGFDTSRDAFCGLYRGADAPKAVFGQTAVGASDTSAAIACADAGCTDSGSKAFGTEAKTGCAGSIAHGWAPVGAMQFHAALKPGEKKDLLLGLGYIENPKEEKWEAPGIINKKKAHEMISRYQDEGAFERELSQLKEYWTGLLSNYQAAVHTGCEETDQKLNRMVNIWNQYQCMVTFNMSRSASYFESGMGRGMGFRDSCQDLLGFVHIIPERARERILDIAATQFPDGSAYHQYQPLTKKGNLAIGSGFNDDPLWLVAGTEAYIAETGDFGILDEIVDFDNDPALAQPLLEHLRRSVNYTRTHLGPHKLPLIGRADWNDCLNLNCFSDTPGESFQTTGPSEGPVAESVFIGGMFVKYGNAYAGILRHLAGGSQADANDLQPNAGQGADRLAADQTQISADLLAEAAEIEQSVHAMEQAILDAGWDGEWFLRAYDAESKPVGSHVNDEGQIYIESQGMCVMAGVGKETGQAEKALQSVKERLDTKYGIVLLQPAYTSYRLNLGEVSSYPSGYKENAGIFCHNNPWIVCAETVLGHGDRAFEIYRKTCPAFTEEISEIHRTEPYVYSQMIAGRDAPTFGEAKNSWLTGTAAWTFACLSQYILGIKPEIEGLKVNPVIPAEWNGLDVTRVFRGTTYRIHVDNSAHVQQGIVSAMICEERAADVQQGIAYAAIGETALPVTEEGSVILPVCPGKTVQITIRLGGK